MPACHHVIWLPGGGRVGECWPAHAAWCAAREVWGITHSEVPHLLCWPVQVPPVTHTHLLWGRSRAAAQRHPVQVGSFAQALVRRPLWGLVPWRGCWPLAGEPAVVRGCLCAHPARSQLRRIASAKPSVQAATSCPLPRPVCCWPCMPHPLPPPVPRPQPFQVGHRAPTMAKGQLGAAVEEGAGSKPAAGGSQHTTPVGLRTAPAASRATGPSPLVGLQCPPPKQSTWSGRRQRLQQRPVASHRLAVCAPQPRRLPCAAGVLVRAEHRETGSVAWSVYWRYVVHIGVSVLAALAEHDPAHHSPFQPSIKLKQAGA